MKDRSKEILTIVILLLPLLFVLPGGYLQRVTGYVFLYLIQGYIAWFLLFRSGQFFFGYSVTMALGAYCTIVLTEVYKWPVLTSMAVGTLAAGLVGVGVFFATIKARGFYVGMTSFLLAVLFPKIIEGLRPITGGQTGIFFTGLEGVISRQTLYLIIVLATVGIVAWLFWFMKTKTGAILTAISENDRLTQALGINTTKYKALAYAIACLFSGFGGALYVNYTGNISSTDISLFTAVYIYFIPLLGGRSVPYGPLIGTAIIILGPELFVAAERYMNIILGTIFALIVIFLPNGVGPSLEKGVAFLVQLASGQKKTGPNLKTQPR